MRRTGNNYSGARWAFSQGPAKKRTGQRSICRFCGRQCTIKADVGNVCRECTDAGFGIGKA